MIVLDAVTDSLQVVLAGAVATSQLACYSAYRDITTTAYTPGKVQTATNNATDVDIVTAPAAATQRVVDYVSVYNLDTASATVTLKFNASGTERILWKGLLAVGEKVEYAEGVGWRNFDNTGTVKGVGAAGSAGTNGGGTVLGSGTSIVDFATGAPMATVDVTGQAAILSSSLVYCWITPVATVDHSVGEHIVESIKVVAGDIVAGVGFTIYALCPDVAIPKILPNTSLLGRFSGTGQASGRGQQARDFKNTLNRTALLSGKWSVGWFYTQ